MTPTAPTALPDVDHTSPSGTDNSAPHFLGCMYHPDHQAFSGGLCLLCMQALETTTGQDDPSVTDTTPQPAPPAAPTVLPDVDHPSPYRTDNSAPHFLGCMYHPDHQAFSGGLCLLCMQALETTTGQNDPSVTDITPRTWSLDDSQYAASVEQLRIDCPYLEQLAADEFAGVAQQLSTDEMAELGGVLKALELCAVYALGVAEVEEVGQTSQSLGTTAHKWFEELNENLTKPSDRVGSRPEYFSIERVETSRHAKGSKSVDLMITLCGNPLMGVDLKSGRPWSPRDRLCVADHVGAPVIQIGPYAPESGVKA